MKVLIDIGHPAHVHYFKNFIWIMQKRGHQIYVTARDKEIVHYLLKRYKIKFYSRGTGGKGIIGKAFYLFKGDYFVYKVAKKIKPDILLSFGSPYAAQVSFLLRKPHIALDDTEHAIFEHINYIPFTNIILTPANFRKNFGTKHIRINSTLDLCYLHPKYFTADESVLEELGIKKEEKYIFMRFVSWSAIHDIGQRKMDINSKVELVKKLSRLCKIFLSSETNVPKELSQYTIKIPFEKIHSVLFYSSLYVGDSTSMATEAATLGVPSICCNSSAKYFGVFEEFISRNMIEIIYDTKQIVKKSEEILNSKNIFMNYKVKLKDYIRDKIDINLLLVYLVENYPYSFSLFKNNKLFINKFRFNANENTKI